MTVGTPTNPDETYCTVDDVQKLIRGYPIEEDSHTSTEHVEDFIEKRTRYVERNTRTAWRTIQVENLTLDAHPNTRQQRQRNRPRNRGTRSGFTESVYSTDKWVKIELPHDRIDELTHLETYTSVGDGNDILEDTDKWLLDEREGVLRVDYRAFTPTRSGRFGSNRMKDARINVSYEYGRDSPSPDIEDATRKLVVYDIITSDAFSDVRGDEENFVTPEEFSQRIYDEAHEILSKYE